MTNSIVSVYRKSDGKLLRYEDSDAKVIAHIVLGKIKVTSYGTEKGYYVSASNGKLMILGDEVHAPKWTERS